jgi:hypothetical protein
MPETCWVGLLPSVAADQDKVTELQLGALPARFSGTAGGVVSGHNGKVTLAGEDWLDSFPATSSAETV